MTEDTYTASDGRTITRVTFVGKEGDRPFSAIWCEGYGDIGDRVIGSYHQGEHGPATMSGPMFER